MLNRLQLDDRLIAEIVQKIHATGSLETGLMACGVSTETYRGWRDAYDDGAEAPLLVRLFAAVNEAEADIKMLRENQLQRYFEKNWQALAWWLERKYPNEYGPKVKQKTGGERDAPRGDNDVEGLMDLLPRPRFE